MSDLKDRTISRQNAEIRSLRDQVEERDERIRQLIDLMRPKAKTPAEWNLTASEERLFVAFATREFVDREIGNTIARLSIDAQDPKLLNVRVFQLRRKLKAAGVDANIQTVWGRGYRLENASQWKELLR